MSSKHHPSNGYDSQDIRRCKNLIEKKEHILSVLIQHNLDEFRKYNVSDD